MNTAETRTGYGDRHHRACTCLPCEEALLRAASALLGLDKPIDDMDTPERRSVAPAVASLPMQPSGMWAAIVAANPDLAGLS